MRKYIYTILFCLISVSVNSQVALRAGMGINFQNTPSLNDYLNRYYASPGEQLGDFNSVIIFSVEGGYQIQDNHEIALEIGYLISSYTYNYSLGKYEFFYNSIMPSVINYYVINGTGYQFKFGGGAGIRILNVEETQPGSISSLEYSTIGYGFLLKADGNTLLGEKFYANIGVEMRYDLNGEPENNGSYIINNATDEKVNLNSLSFGIRLGLAYIF